LSSVKFDTARRSIAPVNGDPVVNLPTHRPRQPLREEHHASYTTPRNTIHNNQFTNSML
jgi:hypothetical protein